MASLCGHGVGGGGQHQTWLHQLRALIQGEKRKTDNAMTEQCDNC